MKNLAKIFPMRICGFNQSQFFGSKPALDGFFPSDGAHDVVRFFKVDKSGYVVFRREAWHSSLLMLKDTPLQIVFDRLVMM
jgi:hypothetical protein